MKGYSVSGFNWLGIAAGALMIFLPFAGVWWSGSLGAGALEVALSPFDLRISVFGSHLSIFLVELFLLAARITFIIAGALLILGSIWTRRWWSGPLMRFGVMKPFWSVLGLVIILAAGSILVNMVLPMIISSMSGGQGPGLALSVPFIVGSSVSTISIQNVTITAPVTFSLTQSFWLAVVTAGFGIAARIYHRRFGEPEGAKSKR